LNANYGVIFVLFYYCIASCNLLFFENGVNEIRQVLLRGNHIAKFKIQCLDLAYKSFCCNRFGLAVANWRYWGRLNWLLKSLSISCPIFFFQYFHYNVNNCEGNCAQFFTFQSKTAPAFYVTHMKSQALQEKIIANLNFSLLKVLTFLLDHSRGYRQSLY